MGKKYKMSAAQKRLFITDQVNGPNITYNIPLLFKCSGVLNIQSLQEALNCLCKRHEPLRTHFSHINEKFIQEVEADGEINLAVIQGNYNSTEEMIKALMQPFDLSKGPLMRAIYIDNADNQQYLYLDIHHIICDGGSTEVLIKDLMAAYNQAYQEPLPIQYKDYAAWQNQQDISDQERYWLEQFAEEPESIDLITDYPRPKNQQFDGDCYSLKLDAVERDLISSRCKELGVTEYVGTLSAFLVLLHKYTGQDSLTVGMPMAGRDSLEIQNMLGMFVNTIAFKKELDNQIPFSKFVYEVEEKFFEVLENQNYPFEELTSKVIKKRDSSRNPLFDVMFAMESDEEVTYHLGETTLKPIPIKATVAKFDLTITLIKTKVDYCINLEYRTGLYKAETIAKMAEHFRNLLLDGFSNLNQPIESLSILDAAERATVLQSFNQSQLDFPQHKTIIDLFEEQVAQHPNQIAVEMDGSSITYRELNNKANYFAHILIGNGVKPNHVVGLIMNRSIDMIVAIYAVLKAGGAYLPISPTHPQERIRYMLSHCGCKQVLSDDDCWEVVIGTDCKLINVTKVQGMSEANPVKHGSPDDLAYVIFTSGTTGEPKGVAVKNSNLVNLVTWQQKAAQIGCTDVMLQKSTYIFDAAVWEIFVSTLSGAKLLLISEEQNNNMDELLPILRSQSVTHALFVPSFFRAMLDYASLNQMGDCLKSFKQIFLGAEETTKDLVMQYLALTKNDISTLTNLYGPTEGTVCVTAYPFKSIEDLTVVPIGRPVGNTKIYVFRGQSLCGIGVPGELCFSGESVTNGYLNRADLTAKSFVPNPLSTDEIIYRTGDLVRWLPDGNIEYLGRIDGQVKIRGFRIELSEIENRIRKIAGITDAIVIARDNQVGEKYLCGYFSAHSTLSSKQIKEELEKYLPSYMIPTYIIQVSEFSKTNSGKINKSALPEPTMTTKREIVLPKNQKEQIMVDIFKEILGTEQVSTTDNFFELGGDSIKAIRILSKLRSFGYKASVKDIMHHKTVCNISAVITENKTEDIQQGEVTGNVVLTPIQKEFFNFPLKNHSHFNQSLILKVNGILDIEVFQKATDMLVKHHDVLRSVFPDASTQVILSESKKPFFTFDEYDLSQQQVETVNQAVEALCNKLQSSFELSRGPLVKIALFQMKERQYLFMCIHHLVVDGVSWRILIEDLNSFYTALSEKQEIRLPAKTMSYQKWGALLQDYAAGNSIKKERKYWETTRQLLQSNRIFKEIENDYKRNIEKEIVLNKELTEKLLYQTGRTYNTEINDILLTALGRALQHIFKAASFSVTMEGHGREALSGYDVSIDRTVGWFTTMYPVMVNQMPTDLEAGIIHIKETLRRVPNNGIGYGILKWHTPELSKDDICDISFNYLGELSESHQDGILQICEDIPKGMDVAAENSFGSPLSLNGFLLDQKLTFSFFSRVKNLSVEQLDDLAEQFIVELQQISEHCANVQGDCQTPSDFGEFEWSYKELQVVKEVLAPCEIEQIYPMTAMQEGMVFHKAANQDATSYVVQTCYQFEGLLDFERLNQSFAHIAEKHQVLRTSMVYQKVSEPRQVLLKNRPIETHLRSLQGADVQREIEKIKEQDLIRGFDLEQDSLVRANVIQCQGQYTYLLLSFHHIIIDGWSMSVLLHDLFDNYQKLQNGIQLGMPESQISYFDYVLSRQQHDIETALKYWEDLLEEYDLQAGVRKATTRNNENGECHRLQIDLSSEDTKALEETATKYNVTYNTFIEAAWGILLQNYNHAEDVVFGKVVSGRNADIDGIDDIVGLFINTIPVRVVTDETQTCAALLTKLQQQAIESTQYDYCSLAQIQNVASMGSGLFSTILAFENYHEQEDGADDGLSYHLVDAREETNYELTLSVYQSDVLHLSFLYNDSDYTESEIITLLNRLAVVLKQMIYNPEMAVKKISHLLSGEKDKILNLFNQKPTPYPADKTITQLFAEQVKQNPEAIAVVKDNRQITYLELHQKSNQLARKLINLGVKSNEFIGIWSDSAIETMIGILGILKAGCAYMPIDSEYPLSRIEYLVRDSKCKVILTSKDNQLIDNVLSVDLTIPMAESSDDLDERNQPESLAYLIYTSGTTGEPKGVIIKHQSVIRLVRNTNYTSFDDVVILQTGSLSFDASTFEIWGSLLNGGKLCLLDKEFLTNVAVLKEVISKNQITSAFFTAALFNDLVNQDCSIFEPMQHVLIGGEAASEEHVKKFLAECSTKLSNGYGPTECTTFATHYPMDGTSPIPIGKPLANTTAYVLANQQLCGVGMPGELYLGGAGLSVGYLNNEKMTAEKYIDNPVIPGERIYRTGDMACWREDGNIEYLGRVDEQVKIRGFRIELGEIENRIRALDGVRDSVVKAIELKHEKYLCAYVICEKGQTIEAVKAELEKLVPAYMVPSFFIQMDEFRLNKNGKVNKKELPMPETKSTNEFVLPRTNTEALVAQTFEQILDTKVSVYDDFFALGGHSLKATRLINLLQEQTAMRISIKDIFSLRTVEKIAHHIETGSDDEYQSIQVIEKQSDYPVSSTQKRMFIVSQMQKDSVSYNIPNLIYVDSLVDAERLQQALNQMVARHEILRTCFALKDGEPVQKVLDVLEIPIGYQKAEKENVEQIFKDFIQPFDLTKAPLLRMKLVAVSEAESVIMIDIHHIIFDGGSTGVFFSELADLYNGKALTKQRIQYKDYAAWQNARDISGQEQYWLSEFSGEIPTLELYTDYPRPSIQSTEGSNVISHIPLADKQVLESLKQQTGTTDYMVLLSIFMVLLNKYTSKENIIVGTPVAGRVHPEANHLIGMFVNTLVLQCEIDASDSFLDVLKKVKAKSLNAFENQEYPLEALVEKLDIHRDMSRNPLFDIVFALQNNVNSEMKLGQGNLTPVNYNHNISKFDLTLSVTELEHGFELDWEYCSRLFKRETIERIAKHFNNLVKNVLSAPEIKLSQLDVLDDEEKNLVLHTFNDTACEFMPECSLTDLFRIQAQRTPERIAVSFEDERITYQELDEWSDRLAVILAGHINQQQTFISIMSERRKETVVGIMAILKAGGVYVPIDVKYPADRVQYILENSGSKVLVYGDTDISKFDLTGIDTLCTLNELEAPAKEITLQKRCDNSLAYLMYTSGTTGEPKGTMITDRNILKLVRNADYVNFNEIAILQTGSFTFDASTFELWGALLNGGRLHVINEDTLSNIVRLKNAIADNQINTMFVTTSLFNQLLDLDGRLFANLRQVLTGGEKASEKHFRKFIKENPDAELVHVYGPTECTTFSTGVPIDENTDLSRISIGKPISNTTVYVMNQGSLCGIGLPGEAYIGGEGICAGYLNNEKLTKEKFIQNPFVPNEIIYRTGDLVRWMEDGNIEFLGRIDNQVKIRGFRIELSEIENVLRTLPAVKDVSVQVKELQNTKFICAYVISEQPLDEGELKVQVSEFLPEYMVPQHITFMDKFPLNKNGKIDTAKLPEPVIGGANRYVAARNVIERTLQDIFSEVLGIDKISVDANFFDMGGDSIKAIRIISKMREAGFEIDIRSIIQNKTIIAIGKHVKRAVYNQKEQERVTGSFPVTPIQQYLFDCNLAAINHFNQSMLFKLNGRFSKTCLEKALEMLIEHHDGLHSVFANGQQIIVPVQEGKHFNIVYHDLAPISDRNELEQQINQLSQDIQAGLDIEQGPLVNVGVFQAGSENYVLICIHHLVVDGVSWRILIEDLNHLYANLLEKRRIILPYKTSSFKKWSEALREYRDKIDKKEIGYWQEVVMKVKESKFIEKKPAVAVAHASVAFTLNSQMTEQLLYGSSWVYDTEINDLLLTALFRAVNNVTGKTNISVVMEGHGREDINSQLKTDRTVGWYTSMYPVAMTIEEGSLAEHILSVKELLRKIPKHGIGYGILNYYGETLFEDIEPDISFNYLGQFGTAKDNSIFSISDIPHGDEISAKNSFGSPIAVNGVVMEDKLMIAVNYDQNQVDTSLIEQLSEAYNQELLAIIEYCAEGRGITGRNDEASSPMVVANLESIIYEQFAVLSTLKAEPIGSHIYQVLYVRGLDASLRVKISDYLSSLPAELPSIDFILDYEKITLSRNISKWHDLLALCQDNDDVTDTVYRSEPLTKGAIIAEYAASSIQQCFIERDNVTVVEKATLMGYFSPHQVLAAVKQIVFEQDVFRSSYQQRERESVICIHQFDSDMQIPYYDLRYRCVAEIKQLKDNVWQNGGAKTNQLMQIAVFRETEQQYRVWIKAHHSGWDKTSMILFNERIDDLLHGIETPIKIDSYQQYCNEIASNSQEADQEVLRFIRTTEKYQCYNRKNKLVKSSIMTLQMEDYTKASFLEDPWTIIMHLVSVIAEKNNLVKQGEQLPLMILAEDRKNKVGCYEHTMGAFLDQMPVLLDDKQKFFAKDGGRYFNALQEYKKSHAINYLEQIRRVNPQLVASLPDLLSVNFQGIFELDYSTVQQILKMKVNAVPEIFVNRYADCLLLSVPEYEQNQSDMNAILQAELDGMEDWLKSKVRLRKGKVVKK